MNRDMISGLSVKFESLCFNTSPINQSNAWDAWRWRKYMWLAIHEGAITLGVSLHEDMTKLISVSQRQDVAAGTQTAEPLVTLTACLFSFVVGGHEMRPSDTCHHLNYHRRWKILLILRNLNKKQGINTKKILFFVGKQGILAGT